MICLLFIIILFRLFGLRIDLKTVKLAIDLDNFPTILHLFLEQITKRRILFPNDTNLLFIPQQGMLNKFPTIKPHFVQSFLEIKYFKRLFGCHCCFKSQLQSHFTDIEQNLIKYQIDSNRIMRVNGLLLRNWFSVQNFNAAKDYYKVLNLTSSATPEEIKKSYKELAKKYHPDVNKGKDQMFKDINQAYQVIGTPQIKKDYDQSRMTKSQPQPNSQPRSHYQDSYQGDQRRQSQQYQQQSEQYQYMEPGSPQFRQHLRKQNQEILKKYTAKRHDYDNLGRGYEGYEKFKQETLRKKQQAYYQSENVTQETVRKQEAIRTQYARKREEEEFQRKKKAIMNQMQNKMKMARQNSQQFVDGFRKMGSFVKDIFKGKKQ